jgi:hypothetical protein
MAATFGAYIDVVHSLGGDDELSHDSIPTAPQKAKTHTYHSVPQPPSDLNLDGIQWGAVLTGPPSRTGSGVASPVSGAQTPRTPNDLEMSRPQSPTEAEIDGVEVLQSWSDPSINKYRMASVALQNLGEGLNDSAPGALIPYIESYVSN